MPFGEQQIDERVSLERLEFNTGSQSRAFGPAATFSAGAGFAVIAVVGLLLYRPTPIGLRHSE